LINYQKALWYQSNRTLVACSPLALLRGLFDRVIIDEPSCCSAGCSKGHWIGIVVTPTLLTWPGTQWLRPIS